MNNYEKEGLHILSTNNKKQIKMSFSLPLVQEDDSCQFWEYGGEASLLPMRECWYCKYSDFRKQYGEHRAESLCRCPENRIKEEKTK